MKSCRKLFAPIFLALAIGAPVCAGEMNSPPAPRPTPTSCSTKTSEDAAAVSNCTGGVTRLLLVWTLQRSRSICWLACCQSTKRATSPLFQFQRPLLHLARSSRVPRTRRR